ncbi:hypothetical protein F4679DRAFT_292679 [Xylaria curta]|nr:hypothetical protein F4679DRAFT_292679 [Xylaria curta]
MLGWQQQSTLTLPLSRTKVDQGSPTRASLRVNQLDVWSTKQVIVQSWAFLSSHFPHILPVSVSLVLPFPFHSSSLLFPFSGPPYPLCIVYSPLRQQLVLFSRCVVVVPFLLRILVIAGDFKNARQQIVPTCAAFLRGADKKFVVQQPICGCGFLDLNLLFLNQLSIVVPQFYPNSDLFPSSSTFIIFFYFILNIGTLSLTLLLSASTRTV